VGLPVLNIAFNRHLGWTHTVSTIDACDRYALVVNGESYSLDAGELPFEKRSVAVRVRQPDEALKVRFEDDATANVQRHLRR